jgi:hypothetical protein
MGYNPYIGISKSSIFSLNYKRIYKNGYYIDKKILLCVNFYSVNAGEV